MNDMDNFKGIRFATAYLVSARGVAGSRRNDDIQSRGRETETIGDVRETNRNAHAYRRH